MGTHRLASMTQKPVVSRIVMMLALCALATGWSATSAGAAYLVGGSVNKGARPSLARMAHEADGMADGNLPEHLFGEDEDEKAGDGLGLFKMPLLQTPAQAARTHSGVSNRVFDIRHTPRHISALCAHRLVSKGSASGGGD